MKKQIFISAIMLFALIGCGQQKQYSKYLENGEPFDLDNLTFTEKIDTLFSKSTTHLRVPVTDSYFDYEKKKEVIRETLGYRHKIPVPRTEDTKLYFLDKRFFDMGAEFYTDKNNIFFAFVMHEVLGVNPDILLKEIQKKYGNYEVKVKFERSKWNDYQWETEDKIIGFHSIENSNSLPEEKYQYIVVVLKKTHKDIRLKYFSPFAWLCLTNDCKIK
ncbi:MAG: hypothetical protein KGV44_08445 [Flavobacteriaceae bacterium]|nr:hypothetical protein [Flavobacteriaceae bacterium]